MNRPQLSKTDSERLAQILASVPAGEPGLIPALRQAQQIFGALPEPVVEAIARHQRVPISHAYGVITFYEQFHAPAGAQVSLRLCRGTACTLAGSKRLLAEAQKLLGIRDGEKTPDGRFSLEGVFCLGNCFAAPSALVDDHYQGRLTPKKLERVLKKAIAHGSRKEADQPR